MYGIFMESVVIFKNYWGKGFLVVLFAAAFLYLCFMEKDRRLRVMFIYTPATLLLLFFFPLFRKVFVRLMGDGATYYRVLWLIPFGMIIAYAGVCISRDIGKKMGDWLGYITLSVCAIGIMIGGTYVYESQYMSKAQNMYHLPSAVVEICDMIAPEKGEERIWAVFPTDLVYFVRQYDTNIQMPYGRDMVEPVWDYYNEVHEVMNHPVTIDLKKLVKVSRKNACQYLVLPNNKEITGDYQQLGLTFLGQVEGYTVYKDNMVTDPNL